MKIINLIIVSIIGILGFDGCSRSINTLPVIGESENSHRDINVKSSNEIRLYGQGANKGNTFIVTTCRDGNNLPPNYNNKIISQSERYNNGICYLKTVFQGGMYANSYNKDGFDDNGIHKDTGTEYNLEGYNRGGFDKNGNEKK